MGDAKEPMSRQRSGHGRLSYSGTRPWPEVPVGNHEHDSAAVVIIGGGIAGMNMAIDLITRRKVKSFIIIEKGGGFGGTWRDNKFPGSCCDVFSQLYCYSFEQNPDWSRVYPGQEEILNYLVDVAHKYQLYKYTRFNTTVDKAAWNDQTLKWETSVTVAGGKDAEFGNKYTIQSDFLISAVGQLNLPRGIDAPGQEDFQGKIMHTARWDWSYHLENKRVAIIGTGATTAQVVPEIAKITSQLTVCQRSPGWVIPRHDSIVPEWQRLLSKYCAPFRWHHRAVAMDIRESFHIAVTQRTSAYAQKMRDLNQMLLDTQLGHRPDLRAKLRPQYSPGCKRSVISDDYYPALARPNVLLETSKIERFTANGIQFSGEDRPREFDTIILATGFESFAFLAPMEITGRDDISLSEIWSSGAKTAAPHAHKGVMMPHFPNLGVLYGPNTNLSHNSLILMIEAQVRYLSAIINEVLSARVKGGQKTPLAIEPDEKATESYNEIIQKRLQETSFADASCTSWWKRAGDGRIVNNFPGNAIEYQKMMEKVCWDEYRAVDVVAVVVDEQGRGREGRTLSSTTVKPIDGKNKGAETWVGRVVEESTWLTGGKLPVVTVGVFGLAALGLWLGGRLGRLRW